MHPPARAVASAARTFDQRVYVLSRYRLADPVLDHQRARLAVTGARLGPTLTDFVDAALLGDAAELSRLVPVIQRQTAAFEAAAQTA